MPGIVAIVRRDPEVKASELLTPMLGRMERSRYRSHVPSIVPCRVALASVHLATEAVVDSSTDDPSIVFSGEIYPDDGKAGHVDGIARIRQAYQTGDRHQVSSLHGKFVAALWDNASKKLVVVNDRFGVTPLYYAHTDAGLVVASDLKALLMDRSVARRIDMKGLSQFFHFGHYFNNTTMIEGVHVLGAGEWLSYEPETDDLRIEASAIPLGRRPTFANADEWLEAIDDAFSQAVVRRTRDATKIGLSLSGGLDARSILGVVPTEVKELETLSLGIAGSLDHHCAQQMAQQAGYHHHQITLDTAFLNDFPTHIRRMVDLTGGQYLDQCIVMPTLAIYRELGITALLRGHAGELMHMRKAYNYSLDDEALAIRDDASLERWLTDHLRSYVERVEGRSLLALTNQEEIDVWAQQSLQEALAPLADIEDPLKKIWHLFIDQRVRREVAQSMVLFESEVNVRLPYVDHELLDLLLAAPPTLKLGETIQQHILQKRRPGFLGIVNANTGVPIGSSGLYQKFGTLRQRAFAKLGVPGYQPYERLGLWLRREIRPVVEDVLLSPRCLERGVFDANVMRRVVTDHFGNHHNYTFLIMAAMIVELSQQLLFDEEYADSGVLTSAPNS